MDELREVLDQYKQIPLSDTDMRDLMGEHVDVVLIRDLNKFSSIEQLMGRKECVFLLYESKPHYGHWVGLLQTYEDDLISKKSKSKSQPRVSERKPILSFFDPYGMPPDAQLEWIPPEFAIESGQAERKLSKLLLKYCEDHDVDIEYNEFPFQELSEGVSTCGRWVALRCKLRDLSLNDFKHLFLSMYSDDIATILTADESQLKS